MTTKKGQETSIDELWRQLTNITKEVRLSGTPEEKRAFDYIAGELEAWGYDVKWYEHDALTGYPDKATLKMVSPETTELPCNGYALSPVTSDEGITASLIYAGSGTSADLEHLDVAGKIIMTEGLATPGKGLEAARAGAVGQIHITGEYIYEMCISPVWGTPTPETAHLLPSVPAIAVTNEHGAVLKAALERGPVEVNIVAQPYRGWSKLHTLTADLPGTVEDTYVLFSGHLDSWHYGVMDNGTANATQMEVARILASQKETLKRGVKLAFWSGHSHARYGGSTWFADNEFDDLATRCVCHVNIDSVGGKGAIILEEAPTMAETYEYAKSILKEAGYELDYRRVSRSSDQSFWGHGIPSCLTAVSEQSAEGSTQDKSIAALLGSGGKGGGLGWWWHTTEDTIDKIDPEFLKRDADIYLNLVLGLLTDDRLPFEPGAGLREMANALTEYEDSSNGAISLRDLVSKAKELADRSALSRLATRPPAEANQLVSDLIRIVVPVNFTVSGPYDQDLALSTQPTPGLRACARMASLESTSDEYRFLKTRLVRERNRVAGALRSYEARLQATGL
jgi:hypothetical protein